MQRGDRLTTNDFNQKIKQLENRTQIYNDLDQYFDSMK